MKKEILLWKIRLSMYPFIRIFQTENLKIKVNQLAKFSVFRYTILLILFVSIFVFFIFPAHSIQPTGGSVTAGTPQTAPADSAGSVPAQAGNVTPLNIVGYSSTQSWQGYFGNVSGTIQLADASDNVIYNWTLAEPSGEVYASTNSSIIWENIQCFNFTANATGSVGSAGTTNLAGTNLSVLESRFGILSDDVDGVNETFSFTPAGDPHDQFFTANLQFSAGECLSTKVYSPSGPVANQFEEALLYEPITSSVIFASLLEKGTLNGFNNQDNDFEMIVPEDGHGTDTSTTTYYFFVEIE